MSNFINKAARQDEILRLAIQAGANELAQTLTQMISDLEDRVEVLEGKVAALEAA